MFFEELCSFFHNLFAKKPTTSPPTGKLPGDIASEAAAQLPDPNSIAQFRKAPEYGDRGTDVMSLQQQINLVGASLGIKITIDGIFKTETANAISKLQKAAGLPGSGDIGPQTLALLHCQIATITPASTVDASIKRYPVKSKRVYIKELVDLVVAECLKTDPLKFRQAIAIGNANFLKSMACGAFVSMRIRERTNHNDGEVVEMIQKVSDGEKGEAWCMYMQQAGIMVAECLTGKTSRVTSSGGCATVRERAPLDMQIELNRAQRGDVVIFVHLTGSLKGDGHTGDFVKYIEAGISAELFEGNTTSGKLGDEIVSEGGGAYDTNRILNTKDMATKMIVRPF